MRNKRRGSTPHSEIGYSLAPGRTQPTSKAVLWFVPPGSTFGKGQYPIQT